MKKCLLLIPRMGNGGAERVMATIANNLCGENEVQIVTMTDAESFYALDERVMITGLGQNVNRKNKLTLLFSMGIGGLKTFFALKKKINNEKPDVVLSFLQSANMMAILLKMLGGKFRLVVSERCAPEERGFGNRFFEKHFYCKADVTVCQSKKVMEFFKEKDREKMVVIPNPIAASAIPPRFEGKRRHTVVGVGRLSDQKNFEMLIRAFASLPERFSDYTMEIYGGGPLEDKLKALIEEKGLSGRAALMGVKKNVMHYISDVALYVMSSNYEGFPNALAEAMATGIPVISTDFSTGVAGDIVKAENGIVIPVGDEKALVSAMEKMLSEEDKWESMSLENRKLLDTLSEKNVMEKWEQVLKLGK
jgi:GalNAc-alpha-(1->4)-GalNAc-alpha-(1->3)-diNAcBac-PP-undecaprenol alpha-1,4-N-acetyl-D-galactosaminyltransferase